jgi:hypothetical protein
MKLTPKQHSEISIFSPLTEGLSQQIQRVLRSEATSASITFLGTSFKPDPYVQVGMANEERQLTLEVMSNTFLETKLTQFQVGQLIEIGWNSPDKSNPNFWMLVDSQDTLEIAKTMFYGAHLVFGIRPETWFSFGTAPLDEAMNNSGLFWHMKGKSGVACLPGQNSELASEGVR